MRTIEKTIYTFVELSDAAKEKARDWYREIDYYAWHNESLESIKAFCDAFNVTLTGYEVGAYSPYYFKTDEENANFLGIKLRDAMKWRNDMPTGFCLDSTLWLTFADEFKRHGNAKAAFDDALDAAFRDWRADIEYQYTNEAVDEMIEINGYEFYEDGGIA